MFQSDFVWICSITSEIATILQRTSISHLWKRKRNIFPTTEEGHVKIPSLPRLSQQRRTPSKLAIDCIPGEASTGSLTFSPSWKKLTFWRPSKCSNNDKHPNGWIFVGKEMSSFTSWKNAEHFRTREKMEVSRWGEV